MAHRVELERLDAEQSYTVTITPGTTMLGRGPLLKCKEKKVSRNHAEITVEEADGSVHVITKHANPIFIHEDGKINAIEKDNKVELKHGEIFSFLPTSLKFKVHIKRDINGSHEQSQSVKNRVPALPHQLTQEMEQSTGEENITKHGLLSDVTLPNTDTVKKKRNLPGWLTGDKNNTEQVKQTYPKKCKENNNGETSEESKAGTGGSKPFPSPPLTPLIPWTPPAHTKRAMSLSDDEEEHTATKRAHKQTRPCCSYGNTCYRKNPKHKEEYSHPGDDDYGEVNNDSDGEYYSDDDDRPQCEYGTGCYRKNPEHKKQYKHTDLPRRKAKPNKNMGESEVDSADEFDDSFINDDSDIDNDFQPSTTESDSEDEEAEKNTIKRLLQEAEDVKNLLKD